MSTSNLCIHMRRCRPLFLCTRHPNKKLSRPRILAYADVIGWTIVSRTEAEKRRGFDLDAPQQDRAKGRSLFFDDLLDAKGA